MGDNVVKEDTAKFVEGKLVSASLKVSLLTAPEKETIFRPTRVIGTLKIKPGMNILDIGAGTGFFTFRFAETLKGTGKVFATDVDPNMIEYIKDKMQEFKYKTRFSS